MLIKNKMIINNDLSLIITEINCENTGFLNDHYKIKICAKDYVHGYKYHIKIEINEYETDILADLQDCMNKGIIISPNFSVHKRLLKGIFLAEDMDKELDILKPGIIIPPTIKQDTKIEQKVEIPKPVKRRRIHI